MIYVQTVRADGRLRVRPVPGQTHQDGRPIDSSLFVQFPRDLREREGLVFRVEELRLILGGARKAFYHAGGVIEAMEGQSPSAVAMAVAAVQSGNSSDAHTGPAARRWVRVLDLGTGGAGEIIRADHIGASRFASLDFSAAK